MKTYLSNPIREIKWRLLALDALVVFGVFMLSYAMRIGIYESGSLVDLPDRVSWLVFIAVIVHVMAFYVFGLYDILPGMNRKILFINVFMAVAFASVAVAILSYLLPQYKIGRVLMVFHVILMIAAVYWNRVFFIKRWLTSFKNSLVIVGWNPMVEKIVSILRNSSDSGYSLCGVVVSDPKQYSQNALGNLIPVYMTLEEGLQVENLKTVVISWPINEFDDNQKRMLIDLKFQGMEIYDGPSFYERLLNKLPVLNTPAGWVLFKAQDEPFQPDLYLKIKRLVDICFSAFVLVLTSPLLAVTAVAIKIESRGPVFFRQERLGRYERPFTLLKFRTMVDEAEAKTGPVWAAENDSRFTHIGKFLRKTRLDEFPQFINVLKGEMSLVGPRPIRAYFADIFAEKFPFYRLRFKVNPGITGWAQVNMDYVNSEEDQYEKLEYEFYYLYHQSIFLDLFILLKTVQSVLKMRGG